MWPLSLQKKRPRRRKELTMEVSVGSLFPVGGRGTETWDQLSDVIVVVYCGETSEEVFVAAAAADQNVAPG